MISRGLFCFVDSFCRYCICRELMKSIRHIAESLKRFRGKGFDYVCLVGLDLCICFTGKHPH